jgi:hypothetical protein
MSSVYVTRTPENLLSYETAVVCERLKTRYRVRTESNRVITFENRNPESNGFYVFAMTDALVAKIEAYRNREDDLLELITNSTRIQRALTEKMVNYLSIDGSTDIDLNNPEVNGTEFYLTYREE